MPRGKRGPAQEPRRPTQIQQGGKGKKALRKHRKRAVRGSGPPAVKAQLSTASISAASVMAPKGPRWGGKKFVIEAGAPQPPRGGLDFATQSLPDVGVLR